MLSIKNLVVLAVAVTGSVIKRDAAQVKEDLKLINTDTVAVTTAVNNYNGGGVMNALPIVNAQNTLKKDLNTAATDAQNAGPVSEADANDIIGFITGTLEPSILDSINALKAKKSNFDTDGLTAIVKDSLTDLKTDTDNLGAALIAGTPADLADQAKAIQAKIDADFDEAIAFFS